MTRRNRARTPAEAKALFWRVQASLIVLGVIYLALHGYVTWLAYREAGMFAAVLTGLTFGFGDVYWTWAWWNGGPHEYALGIALVASIMAWASWLGRPWTRPAITKLAFGAHGLDVDEVGNLEDFNDHSETGAHVSRESGAHASRNERPGARPQRDDPGGAS